MNILRKLSGIKRNRTIVRTGVFVLGVLILTFLAAFTIARFTRPVDAFADVFRIMQAGFILTLFAYIFFRFASARSLSKTAQEIDSLHHARNRLEAALELDGSGNPLAESQRNDTEGFFHDKKIRTRLFTLFVLAFAILFMISLNSYFLFLKLKTSEVAAINEKLKAVKNLAKEKKDKSEATENDFAKLALTEPESEMRSTPMDEIVWTGSGEATKGFNKLFMALYLNGELKMKIPVEPEDVKTLSEGAKLSLQGDFCLDETNAVPFDLISYHLLGFSNINGVKDAKVVSAPQFIEVRPFREDAVLMQENFEGKGMRMKLMRIVSLLNKFLSFQIALNKAVFTIRISGLDMKNKILRAQIAMLAEDQRELKKQMNKMLKEIPPEILSANMVDKLRMASDEMGKAEKILESLK